MLDAVFGRTTHSLDGAWSFCHVTDGLWREALVPMPWQAQFADLRQASGTAVYQRQFQAPETGPEQELVLRFGAVSYLATVRVNGQEVGTHEGGYLPFSCLIPKEILLDENEIEVTVVLPDGNDASTPDTPFAEIPHGKQSWYGPIGGIWQSVALEVRHRCHLQQCAITADLTSGLVNLGLTLSLGAEIQVVVTGPDGTEVASARVSGGVQQSLQVSVTDVRAWSPDLPALYRAEVTLWLDGQACDTTQHGFGFRRIETRDGKIWLNGAPFYMRGALDQDYYPEGICTPPSVAFLEDQLRKAKALGLNTLRCHIKVPDPRYYEVADRLGMLIWTEIPNVQTFSDAAAARMKAVMQGILARDGNHPSIGIWTLINEDWGTRLMEDASHRAWLAGMYDWLKSADPTRLVVDNSPCAPNFHVKTDLNDFHYYRSVPERRSEWDRLTLEFANGADWTFSPHGDGYRRGDEPLVVSEFGVWGLPDPAKLATPDGSEPWWMETGSAWGDGVAYPHGVQQRFASYRLDTTFGSFDAFITAAQWYQFANLKYQIETIRGHATIQGYVITEFTDVHWESNGLLDMNRNPRVFHEVFPTINADIVIVPRVERYSGVAGGAFRFGLSVALGGAELAEGAELLWSVTGGGSGGLAVPAGQACEVLDLGGFVLTLPPMTENAMVRIEFRLAAQGVELARNSVDAAVFLPRAGERPKVASRHPALAAHARGLGYEVVAQDEADVVLVHALHAGDIAALQAGARYAVLADGNGHTRGSLRLETGSAVQLPDIGLVERNGYDLARRLDRGILVDQARRSVCQASGRAADRPGL